MTGIPARDPLSIVRMFGLYGQFLLFFIAHRSTLSTLGWDDIDTDKAEFLKANIAEQTRVLVFEVPSLIGAPSCPPLPPSPAFSSPFCSGP
ncbi:CerR family C-terminal domain-containing protein [Paraburkholderia mimosarum]|uniref:CerR family C-terminal domain-containing protein n=1 Tax=Paraburkholderia mimosarum TaxID=312026 RepID=UPI000404AE0A|nr:CerR family C-terminal domain-containing protein [Paraburkholderia mimosarum]